MKIEFTITDEKNGHSNMIHGIIEGNTFKLIQHLLGWIGFCAEVLRLANSFKSERKHKIKNWIGVEKV